MPSITGWSGYGYVWILFFIILCDEVIHDVPKFLFKPVNHFYSHTWTRARVKFYGPLLRFHNPHLQAHR